MLLRMKVEKDGELDSIYEFELTPKCQNFPAIILRAMRRAFLTRSTCEIYVRDTRAPACASDDAPDHQTESARHEEL